MPVSSRRCFSTARRLAPIGWWWVRPKAWRNGTPSWRKLRSAKKSALRSCASKPPPTIPCPDCPRMPKRTGCRASPKDYLVTLLKADPSVVPYYRHQTDDLWGCGIDAVSALDCWGVGLPGFQGLKLAHGSTDRMGYTPAGYAQT